MIYPAKKILFVLYRAVSLKYYLYSAYEIADLYMCERLLVFKIIRQNFEIISQDMDIHSPNLFDSNGMKLDLPGVYQRTNKETLP